MTFLCRVLKVVIFLLEFFCCPPGMQEYFANCAFILNLEFPEIQAVHN